MLIGIFHSSQSALKAFGTEETRRKKAFWNFTIDNTNIPCRRGILECFQNALKKFDGSIFKGLEGYVKTIYLNISIFG